MSDEVKVPDGFTRWDGGFMPTIGDVIVEVIFRCGDVGTATADDLLWSSDGDDHDIIAYRVVTP